MKMLTTKEISEAWNISERMVRRFVLTAESLKQSWKTAHG